MNIYDAFQAMENYKLIKATIAGETFYFFKTKEPLTEKIRYYSLALECVIDYNVVFPSISSLYLENEIEKIDSISLDAFDNTSEFFEISENDLLYEVNKASGVKTNPFEKNETK